MKKKKINIIEVPATTIRGKRKKPKPTTEIIISNLKLPPFDLGPKADHAKDALESDLNVYLDEEPKDFD